MATPKKQYDKWHHLAEQMIQMNGGCIDIADSEDDPEGDVYRYLHFSSSIGNVGDSVLFLANKMRRTADK